MNELESVLLIPVPEAEFAVKSLREKYDPVCLRGIPAHITVLFPFYAPDRISPDMVQTLVELFARFEPFAFELTAVKTFPNAVYLEPAPREPFIRLTQAVFAAFPDRPPYGGRFAEINPHLTCAQVSDGEDLDAMEMAIAESCGHQLPIAARARTVVLATEDDCGQWSTQATMFLGGASG